MDVDNVKLFFSSNCVVNLSPDKRAVLRDAYKVLKVAKLNVQKCTTITRSICYRYNLNCCVFEALEKLQPTVVIKTEYFCF